MKLIILVSGHRITLRPLQMPLFQPRLLKTDGMFLMKFTEDAFYSVQFTIGYNYLENWYLVLF